MMTINEGIRQIDLDQLFGELHEWHDELCQSHDPETNIKLSMIDSFEDLIIDSLLEEDA